MVCVLGPRFVQLPPGLLSIRNHVAPWVDTAGSLAVVARDAKPVVREAARPAETLERLDWFLGESGRTEGVDRRRFDEAARGPRQIGVGSDEDVRL